MKLSHVSGIASTGARAVVNVKEMKNITPKPTLSVREEVIARRKKQKQFSLIDMIKTNIETKINEKIKDILGIRF